MGSHALDGVRSLVGDASLSAFERKVAMYTAGGATRDSIAYLMQTDHNVIKAVQGRPRVADFILTLSIKAASGMEDSLTDLNKTIENVADEAFRMELDNMRELNAMALETELADKPMARIKAKVSATQIAQDILDRAGKRAPTRVVQTHVGMRISEEQVDRLIGVAQELSPAIDITPKPEEE